MTTLSSKDQNTVRDTSASGHEPVRATFEQVYEAEHAAMLRLAFLLTSSQELAEDAVQDAFARLLDRFDRVNNPGGFLRVTTINRCRDVHRRKHVEKTFLRRNSVQQNTGPSTEPLDDVLAATSTSRREVLVLRYYLDNTNAEIAELLGIKEATVRTRLHRGLADLRRALGQAQTGRINRGD